MKFGRDDIFKPRRKEGVREQELDDELMLHDQENERVHILNATSKAIWLLSDGGHTLEDMEKDLKKSFAGIAGCSLSVDLERAISEFSEKGLLKQH